MGYLQGIGHNPPDWIGILYLAWMFRQAPWIMASEKATQGNIDLWVYRVSKVIELQDKFKNNEGSRRIIGGLF